MVWENKSNVMTVMPWTEVMPWESDEEVGSGFGPDWSKVGSEENGSELLLEPLSKLDRELCGNITDGYLQVTFGK